MVRLECRLHSMTIACFPAEETTDVMAMVGDPTVKPCSEHTHRGKPQQPMQIAQAGEQCDHLGHGIVPVMLAGIGREKNDRLHRFLDVDLGVARHHPSIEDVDATEVRQRAEPLDDSDRAAAQSAGAVVEENVLGSLHGRSGAIGAPPRGH